MREQEYFFPLLGHRIAGMMFGGMPSKRFGVGEDVIGVRPQQVGDEMRQVNWRVSARMTAARGTPSYFVRHARIDQATRGVILWDRRPAMQLRNTLDKALAARIAAREVFESIVHALCHPVYIDYADALHPNPQKRWEVPFVRVPYSRWALENVREKNFSYEGFFAPEDNLTQAFEYLLQMRKKFSPGTFLFVISDFLACPRVELWSALAAHGWDVTPVIVQDPTWEQSFPDVAGIELAITDPGIQATTRVVYSRREIADVKARHSERLASLVQFFGGDPSAYDIPVTSVGVQESMNLDPVLISTSDRNATHAAFTAQWVEKRKSDHERRR